MKPSKNIRSPIIGTRTLTQLLFLTMLCCTYSCFAAEVSLGQGNKVKPQSIHEFQALQELVNIKRAKGPVFVEIPQAQIFGIDGPRSHAYCSPQVRVTNFSNKAIQELIVGIRYKENDNKYVGSTATRFFLVKIGNQDTDFSYSSLDAKYCGNMVGELEVMHCVYEDNLDCTLDVRPSPYGAIPLRLNAKK